MSARARQTTVRALVIASSLTLVITLIAGYTYRAGVDSDQFANRATAALRDDSVRALIAEKITDEVVLKQEDDLIAARPIIQSVTAAIVGSSAFAQLFRVAVRDVHRALFDRDSNSVTLNLADAATVVSAALEKLRPGLAKKVEATGRVELVNQNLGSLGSKLVRIADRIRILAILTLVITLALAAAAIWISADSRQAVVQLGIGIAAAGVVVLVAYGVLRSVAISHADGPEARAAAGGVWQAFLGDLQTAAWIIAGSGAVIAAAAASLIKPLDIGEPLRQAARWVAIEPQSTVLKVVRGLCFVAAGLLVIVRRDAALRLVLTVVGVFLIFVGVSAILRLIYRPPVPGEGPAERVAAAARGTPWRRIAVPVVAAGLIAATIAVFVGSGGTSTAAPRTSACEGNPALCGRSLPEITLPATHNSMSVPLPGWYSAEQDRPISAQLSDGIRGLLIDTHYADRLPNGKVRTDFGSREDLRRLAKQDGVSPDGVDAALRLRARAGFSGKGKRGMYLCHTLCELGATPLSSILDDLRAFLVTNPGDVLVVINQDYVTPHDFVAAVKAAGLEDFVYRGTTTGDWPTLGQMVDSNQRLVLLAENHAGAAPWYHLAYDKITEETPYTFHKVSQLTAPSQLEASCRPNRGPATGAPLFLINHWISTDPLPRPSDAAKVNAYDPLLRRARECQRVRRHMPNLLAVNFYKKGDLFRVVDTLNGVP